MCMHDVFEGGCKKKSKREKKTFLSLWNLTAEFWTPRQRPGHGVNGIYVSASQRPLGNLYRARPRTELVNMFACPKRKQRFEWTQRPEKKPLRLAEFDPGLDDFLGSTLPSRSDDDEFVYPAHGECFATTQLTYTCSDTVSTGEMGSPDLTTTATTSTTEENRTSALSIWFQFLPASRHKLRRTGWTRSFPWFLCRTCSKSQFTGGNFPSRRRIASAFSFHAYVNDEPS